MFINKDIVFNFSKTENTPLKQSAKDSYIYEGILWTLSFENN